MMFRPENPSEPSGVGGDKEPDFGESEMSESSLFQDVRKEIAGHAAVDSKEWVQMWHRGKERIIAAKTADDVESAGYEDLSRLNESYRKRQDSYEQRAKEWVGSLSSEVQEHLFHEVVIETARNRGENPKDVRDLFSAHVGELSEERKDRAAKGLRLWRVAEEIKSYSDILELRLSADRLVDVDGGKNRREKKVRGKKLDKFVGEHGLDRGEAMTALHYIAGREEESPFKVNKGVLSKVVKILRETREEDMEN